MSKVKENKAPLLNFQIGGVEVINCSFGLPPSPPLANPTNFNFNVKIENKLDHVNKLILVITHIEIATQDDPLVKLGSISVACIFNIENYGGIVSVGKEKSNVVIHDDISLLLNSLSISTTRGVMAQLFKGTFLHAAILPIIDPKGFKKE